MTIKKNGGKTDYITQLRKNNDRINIEDCNLNVPLKYNPIDILFLTKMLVCAEHE